MLKDVKEVQIVNIEGFAGYIRESAIDNIWEYTADPAYIKTLKEDFGFSEESLKASTEDVMRVLTMALNLRNAGDEDILHITLKKFTGEIVEL